jgi:hypothetical protein
MASRHQHRFSINVWVGIVGDQLLGPVVLPNRLTGAVYHRFFVNQYFWNMCLFINDNTCGSCMTGHYLIFSALSRQHLNQTFSEQWIGRGGPVNWPARSPDRNPLDFWLWRHLKTLVYSAPINDLEGKQQRVQNACQEIRVKPGIFDRVRTSVRRRAENCVEMHGNHREHLL